MKLLLQLEPSVVAAVAEVVVAEVVVGVAVAAELVGGLVVELAAEIFVVQVEDS